LLAILTVIQFLYFAEYDSPNYIHKEQPWLTAKNMGNNGGAFNPILCLSPETNIGAQKPGRYKYDMPSLLTQLNGDGFYFEIAH